MPSSSRRPDAANVRVALLEAAARLIATEGVAALTLRRVTDEVGTSTMAVYTHFGGMPQLRRAVREEGFDRLGRRLAGITRGPDPVADLARIALAYYAAGVDDPELYRVMFMEQPLDAVDAVAGLDTFATLVAGVSRCVDDGRFTTGDAAAIATQMWAVGHGVVALRLAGFLDAEQAVECFAETTVAFFVGHGDDPQRARRSWRAATRGRAARSS
jgi:AcrR family transcriptional regulator